MYIHGVLDYETLFGQESVKSHKYYCELTLHGENKVFDAKSYLPEVQEVFCITKSETRHKSMRYNMLRHINPATPAF